MAINFWFATMVVIVLVATVLFAVVGVIFTYMTYAGVLDAYYARKHSSNPSRRAPR
jgi:type IV secretory pathway VirB3-like protein